MSRKNLTMRMHIRRFTRLTNASSKNWRTIPWPAAHFVWHNFVRIHQTLGATPVMEAGLTVARLVDC
jgi:hypothetical protein